MPGGVLIPGPRSDSAATCLLLALSIPSGQGAVMPVTALSLEVPDSPEAGETVRPRVVAKKGQMVRRTALRHRGPRGSTAGRGGAHALCRTETGGGRWLAQCGDSSQLLTGQLCLGPGRLLNTVLS